MKETKRIWKLLVCMLLACTFVIPMTQIDSHAAEYEVVFKAGSHGTVDGEKEVSYKVSANDVFPNEPRIDVETGYVFTGWNKELPAVGSSVNGKTVYVAKYAVVIDGVTYTVRYVDENKVDIATPKTMLGEKGTSVTERAKMVAGYTYQQAEQTFTVSEDKEILFVYTLTNPDEVIRYETVTQETYITQNTQNTQSNSNNQNNQTPGNDTETVEENETPLNDGNDPDTEIINEDETPKSKGNTSENTMMYVIGGGGLLAVLLGLLFVWKKKKEEKKAA